LPKPSCQHRAMCSQNYPVGDSIAKMCRYLAGLSHAQPYKVRTARFGVSKNSLRGVPKIDCELSRHS